MPQLIIGTEYKVKAQLKYNDKYKSYSYDITFISAILPKTLEQQRVFLISILTQRQANELLSKYPNIVEDVINKTDNVDLSQLCGIKEYTWKKIKNKIIDNYIISDIITLLSPIGVTYNMIKKLLQFESNPIVLKQRLTENPYIMTKIKGLGFKTVDEMALKINPDLKVSNHRLCAYIKYYLQEIGNDSGDTWVTKSQLDDKVRDNINECYDLYEALIIKESDNGLFLYIQDDKIALKSYYDNEVYIYNRLNYLNNCNSNINITEEKIYDGLMLTELEQGFKFTDEQKEEIIKCCKSNKNITLISGLAGTGKTTILKAILKIYQDYIINCCALSAKAAQRIYEATGHYSSTIHKLLGWNGEDFEYNDETTLMSEILVIDEASMINVPIFASLIKAVRDGSKIIICGDNGQLPPIGYGNPFNDLLNGENKFNKIKLTKVLRQAEESGITTDANLIRKGQFPLSKLELKTTTGKLQDMTYMFRDNRDGINKLAVKLFFKTLDKSNIDDIVIITPRKNNCINSSFEINTKIQSRLFNENIKSVIYGNKKFYIGDKVIQRENNYEKDVFNGEIGYITNIHEEIIDNKKTTLITVDFKINNDIKTIIFTQQELESLELAYCMTIHLMQGSGVKNVITIIDNTHFKLLNNCLLYTALTRAKEKCLLIAEPTAYNICIKTNGRQRNTWLSIK